MIHEKNPNNIDIHYKTKNRRGFMHPFSIIEKEFILFAKTHSPVIDMGCAYGNVALDILKVGVTQVIACDMEKEHLKKLEQAAMPFIRSSNLQTIQGLFPKDFNFKENTMEAIHISHVLEYLNGNEIMDGLKKCHHWLKPNGKLFVLCYTIFIKELDNKTFKAEYARRKNNHEPWPGYFKNFDDYTSPQDYINNAENAPFPAALHVFEQLILVEALKRIGFVIEFESYLDGKINGATKDTWLDGREYVGIIAVKNTLIKP